MEIYNLFPGSFASNCYLLLCGGEAAVVDPSADADAILQKITEHGATLKYILLTHGHFDHICSLDSLREKTGAPAYIHAGDADMPSDAQKNAFFLFFGQERSWRTPEKTLAEGDVLKLGDEEIRVLHTPGHTQGSVCFLCADNILITGDTLFDRGFGRYDLWGGDPLKLRRSLARLATLDPNLTIYAGHGCPTDLGDAIDNCAFV